MTEIETIDGVKKDVLLERANIKNIYVWLESMLKHKYSFDFVNIIKCEIHKPKEKTTHLLYLQDYY